MFTLSMTFPLKSSGGELFRHLFENIKSLDFPALKVTFHLSAQREILSKSLFSCFVVSDGSFPEANKVQSSAKMSIHSQDHSQYH